ncbi:MAG: serine hydrolase [Bacteroidia bacterium]|nr:serine hydrolase [Bacteroidia bacterium]
MRNRLHVFGMWIAGSMVALTATLYSPEVKHRTVPVAFLQAESRWADSIVQNMSTSAKINQMFILVDSAKEDVADTSLYTFLQEHQPGGLLFRNYDLKTQYYSTKKAQEVSDVPLLIGLDERSEDPNWIHLPDALALSSIEDEELLKELGKGLGKQGKELGLDFLLSPAFAPVYTAQNRNRLSGREKILNKGISKEKLLAVPKEVKAFFPGIFDSLKIREELAPYKALAKAGAPALMLEREQLSPIKTHFHKKGLIQESLKDEIGFEGLLMVDISDLNTQDKSESYLRKAVQVGVDLLMINRVQLPDAHFIVQDMLNRGAMDVQDLNKHVKRSLLARTWTAKKSHQIGSGEEDSLSIDKSQIAYLNQRISNAKLTLLRDREGLIPFSHLRDKRIHLSSLGEEVPHLLSGMRSYGPVSNTDFRPGEKSPWAALPVRTLRTYNPVILSLSGQVPDERRDTAFISSVKKLTEETDVIFVNFASTEALEVMPEFSQVLQVYGSDSLSQAQTAQLLFGGIAAAGKLPAEVGPYAYESGLKTEISRLKTSRPEAVGIDSKELAVIDSIVYEGIGSYAMPGCQVMVIKGGNIIFNESYGHHTYARRRGVFPTDIYDLASVTKVAATTMAAMHMYEKGKLKPEHRLGRFFRDQIVMVDSIRVLDTLFVGLDSVMRQDTALLASLEPKVDTQSLFVKVWMGSRPGPWLDTLELPGDSVILVKSVKAGKMKKRGSVFQARIGEMMSHTSGLPAGLPIRRFTNYQSKRRKIGKYDRYFQPRRDSLYSIQVAGGFYLRNDYLDSLWQDSKLIEMSPAKEYEYSDANMILIQQAIDSINRQPMDSFLQRVYYERLGMQNTAFRPRERFEEDRLIPTEYDARWRGQLLRGYVHDPTSALMGGVAGNAGLFANAGDLAILFQMLLNGGTYGGERYLSARTIKTFTRTQGAHRGYGFDKQPGGPYIIAESASPRTYGHTGFTGTCVWVDPDEDLIFIFLSNRIHPKSNNWKLNQLRIRQRIHQAVYDALD